MLKINNIKENSRNAPLGAVLAQRFNRTVRNFLKKPIFEKEDGNWVDSLSTVTEQFNNRVHTSTKLTPIQVSLKNKEGYVYHNLLDKRKKT